MLRRTKLIGLFGVICACIMVPDAGALHAQDRAFGAGVMLGSPSGLNGKLWVSGDNAVDMGLAWSFLDDGYFHIHGDYLWHFPRVIRTSERFVLYAGLGGRLGLSENTRVGVRIPLGITWWPRSAPIDVFLEVAPILDLAPKTRFTGDGAVGVRFFFE